jgi:hypothetical protein
MSSQYLSWTKAKPLNLLLSRNNDTAFFDLMYLRNWIVCQILTGPLCCRRFRGELHGVEKTFLWKKKYDHGEKKALTLT